MDFAEHVLNNAARLWMEAPADQEQRLQGALLPEGLRWKDGRFGTAVTCLAFSLLEGIDGSNGVASPTGVEDFYTLVGSALRAA